jgi:hypothetical protein
MRVRFTIDSERWEKALAYAKATNRTSSELICEALDQIEARYPKRPQAGPKGGDASLSHLMAIFDHRYLRVPCSEP